MVNQRSGKAALSFAKFYNCPYRTFVWPDYQDGRQVKESRSSWNDAQQWQVRDVVGYLHVSPNSYSGIHFFTSIRIKLLQWLRLCCKRFIVKKLLGKEVVYAATQKSCGGGKDLPYQIFSHHDLFQTTFILPIAFQYFFALVVNKSHTAYLRQPLWLDGLAQWCCLSHFFCIKFCRFTRRFHPLSTSLSPSDRAPHSYPTVITRGD